MGRVERDAVAQRMDRRREVIRAAKAQFNSLPATNRQQMTVEFERAAAEAQQLVEGGKNHGR